MMQSLFFKNGGYFSYMIYKSKKAPEELCDTFHFYFSI